MSNYLLIVAPNQTIARLGVWVGSDGESWTGDLGPSYQTLYVARGADKDTSDGLNIYKGYAVDHQNTRIVFSSAGRDFAPNPSDPVEGCYFRSEKTATGLIVGSDLFCQLPVLYFSSNGVVAISDSLFALTEVRKILGFPCDINPEAVRGRAWVSAKSAQLLHEETAISSVRFAVPGTRLRIKVANTVDLDVERSPAPNVFQGDLQSYRATILEAGQRTASFIRTMLGRSESPIQFGLSGGLDSRVCLAAALLCAETKEGMSVHSNPLKPREFAIASSLAKKFGFGIHEPSSSATAQSRLDITSLEAWFLSCAGIYDALHWPRPAINGSAPFSMGGQGAEALKGMFGWRPISQMAEAAPPESSSSFREQCEAGLVSMGIDQADPWGSEWHYLGFRNAIHSGRSSMVSLIGLRPLLQRKLVGLSRSPINEFAAPLKGEPSLVSDLLIALSPELAMIGFDKKAKNMSSGFVEERLSRLGGRITREDTMMYQVMGNPAVLSSGPPAFFVRLVKHSKVAGPGTPERLQGLVSQARERVPEGLRTPYEDLIRKAVEYTTPHRAQSPASMAIGKLLSLHLTS